MASGGPLKELCEEASCSICLQLSRDLVSLAKCGHNFCRACLARAWKEAGAGAACPQCRATARDENLRPNQPLAHLAGILQGLSLQGAGEAKEGACEEHQEPLKYFCKEDEAPLCAVCSRSQQHKDHRVTPLEEAAGEKETDVAARREGVCPKHQQPLKLFCKEDEAPLCLVCEQSPEHRYHDILPMEEESLPVLRETKGEQLKIVTKFRQLHSFLDEQEEPLLAEMEEVEKEVARKRDQHLAELSKCQQPAADLLDSGLHPQKANVTLDPDTAHPLLILSEDQKSVRLGKKAQALPNNPERFDVRHIVLGREEFTAGSHFWEVLLESKQEWAVGVAKKSVKRKGAIRFSPEKGAWGFGNWEGSFRVFEKRGNRPLTMSGELKRIRVCLNCAGGRVAFFDADQASLLYEVSGASFSGETLLPLFWVGRGGHLKISS